MESNDADGSAVQNEESNGTMTAETDELKDKDEKLEDPPSYRTDDQNPEIVSHNMNDLRALDFNSADEVRQTMKAIIFGKQQSLEQENKAGKSVDNLIDKRSVPTAPLFAVDANKFTNMDGNLSKDTLNSNVDSPVEQSKTVSTRKRRGRPVKAGPSKKIRRVNIKENMFLGKLANVASFKKKNRTRNCDSKTDYMYIFNL